MSPADLAAILDRGACAVATDPLQPRPGPGRRPAAVERAERDALAAEAGVRLAPLSAPARPYLVSDFAPEQRRLLLPPRARQAGLYGEDFLQASIASYFDMLFLTSAADAVFLSINNENRVRVPGINRVRQEPHLLAWRERQLLEAKRQAGRLHAMGLLNGCPDGLLVWPGGGLGWVEVKLPGGYVRPEQRRVHAWLKAWGHRVAVWRSLDHAIADAKAWRAIP